MNNIVIIGVVAIAMLVAFPGILTTIGSFITGETGYCIDVPYDSSCVCPEGYTKTNGGYTRVNIGGIDLGEYYDANKYACRPDNLILDPTADDWNEQVVGFANQLFIENCANCVMDCPGQLEVLIADDTSTGVERSFASAECRIYETPTSGTFAWRANFFIDNGQLHPYLDTACGSGLTYCYLGGNNL